MFCIKCGAEAVAGNFCRKCFEERESLFEAEDFTVYYCDLCKNFERGEVKNQIKEAIKTKNSVSEIKMKTRPVGNRIYVTITCTGRIRPLKEKIIQEKKIIIFSKKRKCENCVKLLGGYYEGCLQVRGENQERIMKKIEKVISNDSIAGMEKLKEGFDIRIIKKSDAVRIVAFLREYFSVTGSYKMAGDKKGKKLYRNYYAIR